MAKITQKQGTHPMTYLIQIDEAQRIALLELVRAAKRDMPVSLYESDDNPLAYWEGMLEELPKLEAKHPGNINGFCL